MTGPDNRAATLEPGFLLLFLAAATLAFALVNRPLIGAILGGVIAAILFAPLNDGMLEIMPWRRNFAATFTLLIIFAMAKIMAHGPAAARRDPRAAIFRRFRA